jgi:hypothetical protein
MDVARHGQQRVFREWGCSGVFLDGQCHKLSYNVHISYKEFSTSSSSFGIQLSIHWMITSCCACVGIRNNNKFSRFITYLQVVPTETNFVVKTIYNFIFI